MAQKDLAWFVAQRAKKLEELKVARDKAKAINKEIRELTKQIATNLNDMVMTGSNNPIDDNNFGWNLQTTTVVEKTETK